MNILALGAHSDDIELGCGGSLARYASLGHNIYLYVATKSGYSDSKGNLIRSDNQAEVEATEAASIIGAKEIFFGGFDTFQLEFNESLNSSILKILERYKIDMIFTHWSGDIHHDHQSLAKATLHSTRHVKKILMYRSNWYQSTNLFFGNYYIDISNHWEVKEAAINCHESEVGRTNGAWLNFFKNEAENCGLKIGVKFAESFEVVKFLES